MEEPIKIRDPIHGFINFEMNEQKILNTLLLQRLRGIQQLAFANLVYPGALNTRFDHSLGVFNIACKMIDSLKLSDEKRVGKDICSLLKISALLHDIGHGPFSHVSEDVLSYLAYKGNSINPENYSFHERIASDIILLDKKLKSILGQDNCEIIAKLLFSEYGEPINRSIICGPVDADKLDYLLRDSYFCGVKYGVYDINQLITELRKIEDPSDQRLYLAISEDGIKALEQFVLAKYYITTQVYRHRVRLITDQMLIRAIKLGIESDNIKELRELFYYKAMDEFYIKNYLRWDDEKFVYTFGPDGKFSHGKCSIILKKIIDRNLFKSIYKEPLKNFPESASKEIKDISHPKMYQLRSTMEKELTTLLNKILNLQIESDFLIIHSYKMNPVDYKPENDMGELLVSIDNKLAAKEASLSKKIGPPKFSEESILYSSISRGFEEVFIEIFAPLTYNTVREKEEIKSKLREPITECLVRIGSSNSKENMNGCD